jgi:antitoxin HigA-1
MQIHKPAHPGEVLKEMYLHPLNLSVTDTAQAIGVSRKTLSELVNQQSRISTIMALRLSKAFGTTPELWLNMQQNHDLWNTKKRVRLSKVKVLFEA